MPEEAVRREWPDWAFELFLEAGFLTRDSGALRPDITIVPRGELLFISDALSVLGGEHAAEFVLPAGTEAASALLDLTLRTSVGRTLDLGTGCGEQALLAAAHSEHVVATDINPRAVRYAEMNARLNGIDNVEIRTGDLFAPVNGESFDLIVSNPPFVPAPGKRFTYRDTDDELDGLCRRLVTQAPGYLTAGGILQMLCEWVELRDEPWQQRIAGWLEGTGCDGWVLHWPPRSPDDYTAVRLGEVSGPGLLTGSEDFAQWAESFSSRQVTGIHAGLVVMRRREGRNWIRYQPVVRPVAGPAADTIRRCMAGSDFVDARVSDQALLGRVLHPCPDLRVEQAHEYRGERWQAAPVRARLIGGLALETELDPAAAILLNQFDGLRTVLECLDRLAEFMGTEPVKIADSGLETTRSLISSGLLLMSER
jgi:SAM-dependent methyltransferase